MLVGHKSRCNWRKTRLSKPQFRREEKKISVHFSVEEKKEYGEHSTGGDYIRLTNKIKKNKKSGENRSTKFSVQKIAHKSVECENF